MGSACCVAAKVKEKAVSNKLKPGSSAVKEKEKPVSNELKTGSTVRVSRYSPSGRVRTDNQSNVESRANSRFSAGNHRNDELEGRRRIESVIKSSSGIPNNRQSRITKKFGSSTSDSAPSSALSIEVKDSVKTKTPPNQLTCASSPASIPSISKTVPSSAQQIPLGSNTLKQTSCSPGGGQSKQVSEKHVSTFSLPIDTIVSEGRNSLTLSLKSGGSFSESSDGWSMRTFSELVALQRDRWSFDSESTASTQSIVTGSNSNLVTSPAVLQACGICSKRLTEMLVFGYALGRQLSAVSILFCGHVFHAECLERMTTETNKFDPVCPVCTVEGKPASIFAVKLAKSDSELKAKNKLSRIGVADGEYDSDLNGKKGSIGGSKLVASSSRRKLEKALSQWNS